RGPWSLRGHRGDALQTYGQARRHRAIRSHVREDATGLRTRRGPYDDRRRARCRRCHPRALSAKGEGVHVNRTVEIVGVPMDLGGDHSMGMRTLAGIAHGGRRPGVIWMDAHGDSNTPKTSPSGNVHGMPFAVAFGLAADPFPKELRGSVDGHNGVLVALRSVDQAEKENIKAAGVTPITMADIDRLGMSGAMEKAIAVASKGDGIHLSLDMDAIDPDEAPGVGTPVRGGLTYREAQLAMEMLAASGKLRSLEIAEVNPILDQGNRTAAL